MYLLRVLIGSFELPASVVIGQSVYFGFGFKKLVCKSLYGKHVNDTLIFPFYGVTFVGLFFGDLLAMRENN